MRRKKYRTIHERHQLLPSWLSLALWRINLPKCFLFLASIVGEVCTRSGACVMGLVSLMRYLQRHIITHLHLWRCEWMNGTASTAEYLLVKRWTMCGGASFITSQRVLWRSTKTRVFFLLSIFPMEKRNLYHSSNAHWKRTSILQLSIRFGNLSCHKVNRKSPPTKEILSTILSRHRLPHVRPGPTKSQIVCVREQPFTHWCHFDDNSGMLWERVEQTWDVTSLKWNAIHRLNPKSNSENKE